MKPSPTILFFNDRKQIGIRYTKIEEIDEENLVDYLLDGKGRIYQSEEEETAESKDEAPEDVEKQEEEVPEAIASDSPQFEMPDAVNTSEDAYTVLSIALLNLSESGQEFTDEQKYSTVIGEELAGFGLNSPKRQELGLGERLRDFLNKAEEEGWITKLDDGQYIPTARFQETENENDAGDESDPKPRLSEIESDDDDDFFLPLDDYDFDCKIRAFVKYITQQPLEKQEVEDA